MTKVLVMYNVCSQKVQKIATVTLCLTTQCSIFLDSSATTPKRNKSRNHSSLLDSPTLKMPQSPISPISTPHNRKRRRDSDLDGLTQKSKRDRKYSPLTWMMRKNTVVDHDLISLVIWENISDLLQKAILC